MEPNFQQRNFEREPTASREVVELRALAYKLLNVSLTGDSRVTLLHHGMPPGEMPTIGNMFEMILAPELPLLDRATEREREQWGGWVARLMVLYRQHIQSDEFLTGKIKTAQLVQFFELPEDVGSPQTPFSRSDFDVLSFSAEIARQLGERVGGKDGPTLGRAFQYELRRCGKIFDSVALHSAEASRKLGDL